jgi:predicted metalloprotease
VRFVGMIPPVSIRRVAALALTAGLVLAGTASIPAATASADAAQSDTTSFARSAVADIQAYWATTMPEVYGRKYRPIPEDRLFPYTSDNPPPACGGRGTTPYQEVAGNAFYCSDSDFVAWDAQQLMPSLQKRFGDLAVALVLAHEWGHVIQARTSSTIDASVYLETQADCFAGAWARHVESGVDTSLSFDSADLDAALGGYLGFRDPPGIDASQQGAHGNGFDRISAFQDGYQRGASECATYEKHPPAITESSFTSFQDYSNNGDVSLADTIKLVPPDLDDYWAKQLKGSTPVSHLAVLGSSGSTCDGSTDGGVLVKGVEYCNASKTVVYDRNVLSRVYRATGDFGAGMVLAAEWSVAAEHSLGTPTGGTAARLLADCLTGTWAGDVARGTRVDTGSRSGNGSNSGSQLSLSPGDLDQGIGTFLSLGGRDQQRGTGFSRVAAFRKGFFDGVGACTSVTA